MFAKKRDKTRSRTCNPATTTGCVILEFRGPYVANRVLECARAYTAVPECCEKAWRLRRFLRRSQLRGFRVEIQQAIDVLDWTYWDLTATWLTGGYHPAVGRRRDAAKPKEC